MSDKIQFYTNPMSRGQIARWGLHEAGAEYDEHIIAFGPEMKGEYRKTDYSVLLHRGGLL